MAEEYNQNAGSLHKNKKQASGFAQYSFIYELYKAIMVSGLKMPTPVQRKVIPAVMSGKDAIVCYKTGSGKTLSYLLPMINKLKCHSKIVGARALVLIPTRDLAQQITKVLKQFVKFTDLKYTLLLGGHTYEGQFESLSTNPDIIIATPGRLMQLLQQTDLKLGRIQMVVYDEADQLFENGSFYDQLKQISQKCPISQRLMFSATITESINQFAKIGLKEYSYIHQQIALPQQMIIDSFIIRPEDKASALFFILQKLATKGKVIVFASTRYHVDYLVSLVGNVYQCNGIYGQMDMVQRTNSLDNFRRSKQRAILIVTDVAARGLDIPSVQYVIHYDYPTNHKTFVHRSGRTARKELQGHTIALISNNELPYIIQLSQYVGRRLTCDSNRKQSINIGSIPVDILGAYGQTIKKIKQIDDDLKKLQQTANKAFEKFKTCRSEVNQSSIKKAKNFEIPVHFQFGGVEDQEEEDFINRIRNFAPKRSFLELQRIMADVDTEKDQFLSAVEKIRTQEKQKREDRQKKEKMRIKNSLNWKQMLNKEQLRELQDYRESKNKQRIPIQQVQGIEIQINRKQKKSAKKDFRDLSHYISDVKDPNSRTQFDELPRIRTNQLDLNIGDENPHKKRKERVWDKEKKNFVWQRDKQDKDAKEQKGKKAYMKWKKKSKLFIPKVGQIEDDQQVNKAKENWLQRRKYRHGWKQNKQNEGKGLNLKNNKTKAIEKKYKKRLISKSQRDKGPGGKFKGGRGKGKK